MASSNQAIISVQRMHQNIREAMAQNNPSLLYDQLLSRFVTNNYGNTKLTEEELGSALYQEILEYVCEQYPYGNIEFGDKTKSYAALLAAQSPDRFRLLIEPMNKAMMDTLRLLMKHIDYKSDVILKVLERAVAKLEVKQNSQHKQQTSLNLMLTIVDMISPGILFEVFLGASDTLLNNFLKNQLNKLPLPAQQALLQAAIQEKKLTLISLLLNQSQIVVEEFSKDSILDLFKQASSEQNLFLVKYLLNKSYSVLHSLEKGDQKRLIMTAIDSEDVDLIQLLLREPALFSEPLNNGKLPFLYAAEKNAWEIANILSAQCKDPSAESLDSYRAFLTALKANTPQSMEFAIKFARENPQLICKYYLQDERGNTALHHAMKNGIEEIVTIILTIKNYTSEGANIEEFLKQKNSAGQTAIALAAAEGKWDRVIWHATVYQPKNANEWVKLYAPIFDKAIEIKSGSSLQAAIALLQTFPRKILFDNTLWIVGRIMQLISNENTGNKDILHLLSLFLEICGPEQRFEIVSSLAEKLGVSGNRFIKNHSKDPEEIKKSGFNLIAAILIPLVRADIILSVLDKSKKSFVWTKDSDTLYNGTRINLIEMLNQDLIPILQNSKGLHEIEKIAEKMNLGDLDFAPSKSSLVGLIRPDLSPVMKMYILRDFLHILCGKPPLFSNLEWEKRSQEEKMVIERNILAIYQQSIEANEFIKNAFIKNLGKFSDSAIAVILDRQYPNLRDTKTEDIASAYASFDSDVPPLPSAPSLPCDSNGVKDPHSNSVSSSNVQLQGSSSGRTVVVPLSSGYPCYPPPVFNDSAPSLSTPPAPALLSSGSRYTHFPPVPTTPMPQNWPSVPNEGTGSTNPPASSSSAAVLPASS